MAFTRGFRGRGPDGVPQDRVPPGQYITQTFPVLSAGSTSQDTAGELVGLRRRDVSGRHPTVRSITFDVHAWMGHSSGQHADIRLTADSRAELFDRVACGARHSKRAHCRAHRERRGFALPHAGARHWAGIELRGPIGGYFTWKPDHPAPLMLIGGGSGVVPLMSMLRTRYQVGSRVPARLLYSSQTVEDIIYRQELDRLVANGDGLSILRAITRGAIEYAGVDIPQEASASSQDARRARSARRGRRREAQHRCKAWPDKR